MYLYIFEDGSLKTTQSIGEGDLAACDDGLIDLIDISGPEPKQYMDGDWIKIESADNVVVMESDKGKYPGDDTVPGQSC